MGRRTLDKIVSSIGLLLTIGLVVAGGLLMWGYTFAHDSVHQQLSQEKVFFPPKGSPALAPAAIGKYLNKYAGQQLTTGDQAKAYADHFIAVHLKEAGGGLTYAQLSAKSLANPGDAKLAAQVQTAFRGETLRGLLLNAYAFGKFAQIALISAIVSFILAALMAVLSLLGFLHARRARPDEVVLAGGASAGGNHRAESQQLVR